MPKRRAVIAILALAFGAFRCAQSVQILFSWARQTFDHLTDLGRFLLTTRELWQGNGLGAYVDRALRLDFLPPFAHLPFTPIAWLPYDAAAWSWLAISATLITLATVAIWREAGKPDPWISLTVVGLALASTPIDRTVETGQFAGVVMGLMTAAWIAWRRGHLRASAILTGVLIAAKPFLVTFGMYWLFTKQWRVLRDAAAAAIACYAMGILLFGIDAHIGWVAGLLSYPETGLSSDGSLLGLVSRALEPTPWFTPFLDAHRLVSPILSIARLAILVMAWKALRQPETTDRMFIILTLTALLLSPKGWNYYLLMIAGPLVFEALRRPALLWPLALLLIPLPVLVWHHESALWSSTVGNVTGWAFLGLFLLTVRQHPRPARATGAVHMPAGFDAH